MTDYPTTPERPVTRDRIDQARVIIAALVARCALYNGGRLVCAICGEPVDEEHAADCPVGRALAWLEV